MVKEKIRTIGLYFLGFCAGGCVGLATVMAIAVIYSWQGGEDGRVMLWFNLYQERLVETILFPICAVGGLASIFLFWRFIKAGNYMQEKKK